VAGVRAPGTADWKDLSVSFYKGGVLQESTPIGQGPSVDTTNASNGAAEQVVTVTPASADDDQVIVSGYW
jgi:hypothetical protein